MLAAGEDERRVARSETVAAAACESGRGAARRERRAGRLSLLGQAPCRALSATPSSARLERRPQRSARAKRSGGWGGRLAVALESGLAPAHVSARRPPLPGETGRRRVPAAGARAATVSPACRTTSRQRRGTTSSHAVVPAARPAPQRRRQLGAQPHIASGPQAVQRARGRARLQSVRQSDPSRRSSGRRAAADCAVARPAARVARGRGRRAPPTAGDAVRPTRRAPGRGKRATAAAADRAVDRHIAAERAGGGRAPDSATRRVRRQRRRRAKAPQSGGRRASGRLAPRASDLPGTEGDALVGAAGEATAAQCPLK